MLVAGRSNAHLAERIARRLHRPARHVTLKTFPSGELYARYDESHPRRRRVHRAVVRRQPRQRLPDGAADHGQRRAPRVGQAHHRRRAAGSRTRGRTRSPRPREPITARLVSTPLHAAGVDRVLTMDLHAGQVQGFFDIPVDHMTALPMFAAVLPRPGISGDEVVVVSADAGRAKLAKKFAEMLGAAWRSSPRTGPRTTWREVTRRHRRRERGRDRDHLRRHDRHRRHPLCGRRGRERAGAARVIACATHPIFSPPALERSPTACSTRSSCPTRCRSTRSRGRRR